MRRLFNIYDMTNQSNRFLTIQNCREDIIGELEAIIQYEKHLMETDDMSAKSTISDIVKEEKVHVGQLFGLLFQLDEESRLEFERGFKEFQEDDRKS